MKIDPASLSLHDAHHLFISAVLPRPIAWVSTVGKNGVFNLAPFSYYIIICNKPAIVGFSTGWTRDGKKKDTLRHIEDSREYVINMVSEPLAKAMNITATPYPPDVSEFKEAGLTPVKADLVKAPLVAESPVNLECRLQQIMEFGEFPQKTSFIMGEVLRVHIKDEFYVGGEIQMDKLKVLGRLGGELYCRINDIFEMKMPH